MSAYLESVHLREPRRHRLSHVRCSNPISTRRMCEGRGWPSHLPTSLPTSGRRLEPPLFQHRDPNYSGHPDDRHPLGSRKGSFIILVPGGADTLTFIGQAVPAFGGNVALDLVTIQSVPEPASLALMIVGIAGLGATRMIRNRGSAKGLTAA
jgi:hypothetical protein